MARAATIPAVLAGVLLSAGCSSFGDMMSFEPVKPWQRGVLAQEDMQLIPDAMENYADEHMYFSKEAATGGRSVGGGGCGCN